MNKIQLIEQTFSEIDKQFQFITLRNFHLIPAQSSKKNDIDILISKADSKKLMKLMSDMDYQVFYDWNTEYLYGANSHIHCVNDKIDVHFDVVPGLYYRSLQQRNLFIGGYEKLEQSMWENKKCVAECYRYIPATEDLLTHLCCHSIFDKMEITQTYNEMIEKLYADADKKKLKELFSIAFHKVADHLISVVESGDISQLVREYTQYNDY
jgi:hypothetical protein